MSHLRAPIVAALVMAGSAALLFHFFQRQMSKASFAFGSHPEVQSLLVESLEDQRRLAEHEPESEPEYRARFQEIETTVHRLQILDHNRAGLTDRYETLVLAIFVACVVLVTGIYAFRQSRHQPRLARLQRALTGLAEGRTDLDIGDRGRDTIGRIATMIERTSRLIARDRRRLAALDNLSAWQEAARRHAHEMRTPLTGLQLELDRAGELIEGQLVRGQGEAGGAVLRAIASARQEASRLGEFTRRFTSFARLPEPKKSVQDLGALAEEFVETYSEAWPNLSLATRTERGLTIDADRDQLRQVLVNLCDNSSHAALDDAGGEVRIASGRGDGTVWLDVSDDGPGVPEEIRGRLFEPYSTTRGIGDGMGLGLAICKKILLDHGGDLELLAPGSASAGASGRGATFRMSLPAAAGVGEPAAERETV